MVFLWWCRGVFVVVWLWFCVVFLWCFCGGAVVFLWWLGGVSAAARMCFCGGVALF